MQGTTKVLIKSVDVHVQCNCRDKLKCRLSHDKAYFMYVGYTNCQYVMSTKLYILLGKIASIKNCDSQIFEKSNHFCKGRH